MDRNYDYKEENSPANNKIYEYSLEEKHVIVL